MHVIARDSHDYYLVLAVGTLDEALQQDQPVVRAFDSRAGILCVPMNMHSVLSRVSYQRYELSEEETRQLLSTAKKVEGPGIDEPWLLPSQRPRPKTETHAT